MWNEASICLRLDLKTVARRYAHPCNRIFHDGSEEGSAAAQVARVAVPFVPRAAYYGFGEVRVATLALLIFTALSG